MPAGLARAIAADPDATWYRMLTDPAGRMVELSTTSYRPTAPIWRYVVADWPDLPQIQFSATELLEVLGEIQNRRDRVVAEGLELQWEHGTLLPGIAV